jgi:hypothetical protein
MQFFKINQSKIQRVRRIELVSLAISQDSQKSIHLAMPARVPPSQSQKRSGTHIRTSESARCVIIWYYFLWSWTKARSTTHAPDGIDGSLSVAQNQHYKPCPQAIPIPIAGFCCYQTESGLVFRCNVYSHKERIYDLVAIMDWHSRKVVSWKLSNTMDTDFCVSALEKPWQNTAHRIPSMPIKEASLPALPLLSSCESRESASPWTVEVAGWAMCLSNASGAH